jgi:hypothetical protein
MRTCLLFATLLCFPAISFGQVGVFEYQFNAESCRHCWKEDCPSDDYKKSPAFAHVHKQVKPLSDSQIEKLFKHSEPAVRTVALIVAGEKKLSLSPAYTAALLDNHPAVRQAARQNLILLNPGQDFGPPPNSTMVDGIIANRMWAKYLKEPWTDGLCENQYDRYYFDSYQQKFILRTSQEDPDIRLLKAIPDDSLRYGQKAK